MKLTLEVEACTESKAEFLDCGCELFACTLELATAGAVFESEELLKAVAGSKGIEWLEDAAMPDFEAGADVLTVFPDV